LENTLFEGAGEVVSNDPGKVTSSNERSVLHRFNA
jgi:hypothetical protein